MSDKTQPPSPRRLREASQRGEVARSTGLSAAAGLLLAGTLLLLLVPSAFALQLRLLQAVLATGLDDDSVLGNAVAPLLISTCVVTAVVCIPCSLAIELAQTRLAVASKALRPRFERLDPARNLRQQFSLDKLANLATTLLQISLCIGALLYFLLHALDAVRAATLLDDAGTQLALVAGLTLRQLLATAAALLPLGVADLWLKRRLQLRRLRMTLQEVRRERREDEGDPHIRQRAREIHQHAPDDDAPGPSTATR